MKAGNPTAGGFGLLEALVGIVLLGLISTGALWTSGEILRSVGRMHATEMEIHGAGQLLAAVSLWPVEDLDRHLGATDQDGARLTIERPQPFLYHVRIEDGSSRALLLESWIFRDGGWNP